MRKIFAVAAMAAVCAGCSQNEGEETVFSGSPAEEQTEVTIHLGGFTMEQEAMTRATTSVSDYVTRLDVWIVNNGDTIALQQTNSDSNFGSLSATLNINNTYTLYAVAHRTGGAATLANGVISFLDDKVTHSFYVSREFQPTKGMTLDLTMQRIVAQFSFHTTDAVPDWCKTMRFTLNNVYDRWNVTTGGVHETNRTTTFSNFNTYDNGTVGFNIYAIVTAENTQHDILVEALNANGDVKESHLFEDVKLRNGYRTTATGAFFTDAASTFTFKAEDWIENESYGF